jgi:hypothetical protein
MWPKDSPKSRRLFAYRNRCTGCCPIYLDTAAGYITGIFLIQVFHIAWFIFAIQKIQKTFLSFEARLRYLSICCESGVNGRE